MRANKSSLFVFFTLLLTATSSFAQQQINLTTYYPAPFGAYDRLRLVPRGAIVCNASNVGLMYFDNTTDPPSLQICSVDGLGTPTPTQAGPWRQETNDIFPKDTASNANLRIGIGTSTPSEALDVNGNILAGQDITAEQNINAGQDIAAEQNITAGQDITADQNISLGGDIHSTTFPGRFINMSRADYGGTIDFQMEDGVAGMSSIFRTVSADIFSFGTRDMFFQLIPKTPNGYGYLESWNAAGLIVGTGGFNAWGGGPILFRPSRTTKMTLNTSGNLGIGTTDPKGLLHVQGANDTAATASFMPGIDTLIPGTPSMNVGIGLTNPGYKLHVLSTSTSTFPTNTSTIRLSSPVGAVPARAIQMRIGGQGVDLESSGAPLFINNGPCLDSGDCQNVGIVPAGGKVSIGNSSPNGKLSVTRVPGGTDDSNWYGNITLFPDWDGVGGFSTMKGELVYDGGNDGIFGFTNTSNIDLARTSFNSVNSGTSLLTLWNRTASIPTGRVDIGTPLMLTPRAQPACNAGTIYYDSGTNHFYGCLPGNNWKQLDN